MPRNPTDTKSRILKVARSLYSSHGCDGTTLDDIITAGGITKGAFYHYFKSKESLCEAVLEEVIGDYRQLGESIDKDAEPIEQLRQIIGTLARLNRSGNWVNCRLILRLSSDSHESQPKIEHMLREFWRRQAQIYEDLIGKCRDSGQLRVETDAVTLAQLVMAVMAGAVSLEKAMPQAVGVDVLADVIIWLISES